MFKQYKRALFSSYRHPDHASPSSRIPVGKLISNDMEHPCIRVSNNSKITCVWTQENREIVSQLAVGVWAHRAWLKEQMRALLKPNTKAQKLP